MIIDLNRDQELKVEMFAKLHRGSLDDTDPLPLERKNFLPKEFITIKNRVYHSFFVFDPLPCMSF